MKKLTVGQFKSQFSDVIARVRKGEKIAVSYGKKAEIIGVFGPPEKPMKPQRQLGLLEGKIEFDPMKFKMTVDEFLNSGH